MPGRWFLALVALSAVACSTAPVEEATETPAPDATSTPTDAVVVDSDEACAPLLEIADGLAGIVDRDTDRIREGDFGDDEDDEDERGTISTGDYGRILDYYRDVADHLDDHDRRLLEQERIQPLARLVDQDPDGDGIPFADSPEDASIQEVTLRLPAWPLLPDGVDLACDGVDTSRSFATLTYDGAAQPTFDSPAVIEASAGFYRMFAEQGDMGAFANHIVLATPLMEQAVVDLVMQRSDETRVNLSWRRTTSVTTARWILSVHTLETDVDDHDTDVIEVEISVDPLWLDRRVSADVDMEPERDRFTSSGILRHREPLEPGDRQDIALIHDPANALGVAVSAPTWLNVDVDRLLDQVLVTLGLN
jgi:hypothetical protein